MFNFNFNIDLDGVVNKMLEKYENSKAVQRLIHMILFLVFLFAMASILQGIGAIKWW